MIQKFNSNVYALLDQRASLSFVNPYVSMVFDIVIEQLSEHFSVFTLVENSILVEKSIMIALFQSISRVP